MKQNKLPLNEAMDRSLAHLAASEERRAAIRRHIEANASALSPHRLTALAAVLIVLIVSLSALLFHPQPDQQTGSRPVATQALQPLAALNAHPASATALSPTFSPAATLPPFNAEAWQEQQNVKADCALWFRDNLSGYIVTPLDERYADGTAPDYISYYLRPRSAFSAAAYEYFAYYHPDGTLRQLSRQIRPDSPEPVKFLSWEEAFAACRADTSLPVTFGEAKLSSQSGCAYLFATLNDSYNDQKPLHEQRLMNGSQISFIWDPEVGQIMDIRFPVLVITPEPTLSPEAASPVPPSDSQANHDIPLDQIYHDLAYWVNVHPEGYSVSRYEPTTSDRSLLPCHGYLLNKKNEPSYAIGYTEDGLLQTIMLFASQGASTDPHPYSPDIFTPYTDMVAITFGVLHPLDNNPKDYRTLLARTYEDLPGVPKGTLVTFRWEPAFNIVMQVYFYPETADPNWI